MKWVYTSQPTVEPVSYADAKAQMRIDGDDERTLILAYVAAARIYAETETQRTLITRQITLTKYDNEPPVNVVPLPRGPVVSIDTVTDRQGNTVNPATYELRRVGDLDYLYWVSITHPATITYTAGFGAAATDVPADIRTAMLLHVAHLWQNREASTARPQAHIVAGMDCIYGQYKVRGLIG